MIKSFEVSHVLVEFSEKLSLDVEIGVIKISAWRLCVHFFVNPVSYLSRQLHFERIFFLLRYVRILYNLFGLEEIGLGQKVEFQVDSFFEVLFELEQFLYIFIQLLEHLFLGYDSVIILLDFLLLLGFHHSADIEISHKLFCS